MESSSSKKKFFTTKNIGIGLCIILGIVGISLGIYYGTKKSSNSNNSNGSKSLTDQVARQLFNKEQSNSTDSPLQSLKTLKAYSQSQPQTLPVETPKVEVSIRRRNLIEYDKVSLDQLKRNTNEIIEKTKALTNVQKDNLKTKVQNANLADRDSFLTLFAILRILDAYSIFKTDVIPKSEFRLDKKMPSEPEKPLLKQFTQKSYETVRCAFTKESLKTSPNGDILGALFVLFISMNAIEKGEAVSNLFEITSDQKYIFKGSLLNNLIANKEKIGMTSQQLSDPMSLESFTDICKKAAKDSVSQNSSQADCRLYDADLSVITQELTSKNLSELNFFK